MDTMNDQEILKRIAEIQSEQQDDPVNHPSHYTYGKIECLDYIEDKGFGFNLGNAVKYITRAGHKKDAVEDLKKAVFYINREIRNLEAKS